VPDKTSFDYAILRVVPRVEREEFVNAGVILFCLPRNYLAARVCVDEVRLRALWPEIDIDVVRQRLEAFPKLCDGTAADSPIAGLSRRQRFHWLVAPKSTIIQVSPVHAGLCHSPEAALEDLFRRHVYTCAAESVQQE
jgi:hypothetical protein